MKAFDLTDKKALVVGGGRGIGREIALAYAEAGADVAVAARTKKEIDETASEIGKFGVKGMAVCADATKGEDLSRLATAVVTEFGRVDILVNCAGTGFRKPIVPLPGYRPAWSDQVEDFLSPISDREWYRVVDMNLTSLFLATRAVGPHMIEQKKGKIINISSFTGSKGYPNQILYCTTKAGVNMYTRSLALEWARYGINVNAIAPGYVFTEMTAIFFKDEAITKALMDSIPLRRLCQPRDVALLAVYLASEASDYLTGQTINLDGGLTS